MRKTFALWFVTSSLACGCAAGLAAPAAIAAGSGVSITTPTAAYTTPATTPQPQLNINNAASNALTPITTPASSNSSSTSSNGLSKLDGFIIAAIAIALLVGIALLVRTDAHKHLASIRHGERADAMFATAHSGSKAQRKSRKLTPAERKRRKRGKAR